MLLQVPGELSARDQGLATTPCHCHRSLEGAQLALEQLMVCCADDFCADWW
jgi:hypothetical protein